VEGLKLAPDIDPIEKIKDLEAQIGKLENFLKTNNFKSHTEQPSSGINYTNTR
jgi:hypothetical protein